MTRTSSNKLVLLLTLFIFLMNLFAHGFNAKLLAHEIDHERQIVSTHHDHALQLSAKDSSSPALPLGDKEHQLLHAIEHVHPLLISVIVDLLAVLPVQTTLLFSPLFALPAAQFDPPFRPPRIIFSL